MFPTIWLRISSDACTKRNSINSFLLVLIELFSLGVYGWGATSEYRFKIGDFAPTGPVDPKFQVERVAPTNHSSRKTGITDLSYGIKICTDIILPFCHNARVWQTDGQTDRRTNGETDSFLLTRPPCIRCSAVKIMVNIHLTTLTTARG